MSQSSMSSFIRPTASQAGATPPPSTPPSAPSSSTGKRGPQTTSAVWEFFTSDRETEEASCKYCSFKQKNRNTTNLRRHLKGHHKLRYAELEEAEKKKKMKLEYSESESSIKNHATFSASSQSDPDSQKPEPSAASAKPYLSSQEKSRTLNRLLCKLFGCTTVALNVVESQEFRAFCHEMDPRFSVPCRNTLKKRILTLEQEVRETVRISMRLH